MAIIDLDDLLDDVHYVYNSLKEVVAQVTKKLQLKADSEAADPDADNSDFPFTLPYQYYATHYTAFPAKTVTHDYDPYTSGNHKTAFAYQLTLNDNVLTMTNLTAIGMVEGSGWNLLSPEQREASYNQMKSYFEGQTIHIISNYPDNATLFSHTSGYFQFFPTGKQYSDIYYKYQTLTGDTVSGGIATMMYSADYTPYIDDSTGYLYNSNSFNQLSSGQTSYIQRQPFEGVFGNLASARAWVSANGATHNYEQSYLVYGGSMTVLYGDNYIIYVVPSGVKVTYNLMKNITQNIATTINSDNPDIPVIKVPTYDENKYGPEPEPATDDDYIDMGLGVETDGMAMYNMAVLTRDDLIQLIGDFETNGDTGLSFLPHVLGLYKLGIESSQLMTTKSDTINLHKEPGKTAFVSTDNYNIVDEQLQVIDCGSITVDREELLTNTYLDFSPYTTYEMFIPGCGWITLPDTVVGRTISVHIVFDLTTCSCKGVVRSEGELLGGSGSTLATVNGIIGSSVPLSINETGLQRGAIMSGAVQTVTALGTSAMGIGLGNPYVGMSGIAMAAGSLAETHIAGNATYTSTKGGATDYSVFGDGYKAVLKITRPKLEIPDNYGHTVGYVVNKYDSLSNYSGFTVCLNPHVTGLTCTSDEKDEIARLLERGVILPSGE